MDRRTFRLAFIELLSRQFMTPSQAARKLGVTRQAVYNWMWNNSSARKIHMATVYRVCQTFGVSVAELEALGDTRRSRLN